MLRFLRKLNWMPRRRRHDAEIREELEFHLDLEAADAVADGLAEPEAQRAARRDLGNLTLVEENVRAAWRWAWLERLARDARYAVRTLLRDSSFTVLAVATLSIGLAATVSIFAVTKSVLLNPLPFPDPDRLVMVWERSPQGNSRNLVSAYNFSAWRSRNQVFDSLGAIAQIPLNVTGLGEAEQLPGLAVSPGFFTALRVAPLMGRTFETGEDRPGGPRLVVMSHRFWQQRYAAAPDVVGRQLTINGIASEIVGVMPAGFAFPASRDVDLYVLLQINPTVRLTGRNLITVGRVKAGVSVEAARADMERIAGQLSGEEPAIDAGYSVSIASLFEEAVGSVRRTIWVAFAAVACLLLLACANVANLLLIRASKRTPEITLRSALGAARWKLVHQLAVENILVAFTATVIGLGLARAALPLIPVLFDQTFPLPRANEIAIDLPIVLLAFAASTAISLCFSVLPVVRIREIHLADCLRTGTQAIVSSQSRLRRGLVVLEVALALVLVFAAGLVGRSLAELYRVQPGFQTERVLTVSMALILNKYRAPAPRVAFLKAVLEEVRATPGVTSAAAIHFLPLAGMGSNTTVYRSDRPAPPLAQRNGGDVSVITPGYFSTMGIRLVGRDFDDTDRLDTPRVTIVNETLARLLFANETPLGQHLVIGWSAPDQQFEIVGVAGDVRTTALDHPPGPAMYIAESQEPSSVAALVLRTAGSPASMVQPVRAAIARIDPDQGISTLAPFDQVIARAIARPRAEVVLLGTIGILALLIAAVGVYGVMAYGIEQRRREMGLRLALGAPPRMLRRAIVADGVRLAAIGMLIGTFVASAFSWSLNGLLYNTAPHDPAVFLAVAATLFAIAGLATLGPARSVTSVDPMVILRNE
jgi:predicted permease